MLAASRWSRLMQTEPVVGAGTYDLPPLLIDVHGPTETHVRRVTVAGEMDMLSSPAVHAAVVDALRRHQPDRIEIDLHDVSFLDSAGIRTLLMCDDDARRMDCPLALVDPHPRVTRVLQIAGLLDHFGLPNNQQ
jgi:anti-anti-sigma factor